MYRQVQAKSVEWLAWKRVRQLASELNRQKVFRLATHGRFGASGITLPDQLEQPKQYYHYSWDSDMNQSSVVALGQGDGQSVIDALERRRILRQAIRLLKLAASLIEHGFGRQRKAAVPWQVLVCDACGYFLFEHMQPHSQCRPPKRRIRRLAVAPTAVAPI